MRVERVARVYARFGERFARRILMPPEFEHFVKSSDPVRFLSMRFAAKEAVVKAMGTGFANGMWVRDVGVYSDPRGRPEIMYSNRGATRCRELGVGEGFLTLSDEGGFVIANAILLRA
ncbi:MAG: holo-ACP synthase [Gammaproteobacteria bacterium]|nr:holo-ACP synthase [Gammaproteobacteria bacterium]